MCGPGMSSGQPWKENRRLFMSSLKDLGMGNKSKMEVIIQEEAERFCQIAEEKVAASKDRTIREASLFY